MYVLLQELPPHCRALGMAAGSSGRQQWVAANAKQQLQQRLMATCNNAFHAVASHIACGNTPVAGVTFDCPFETSPGPNINIHRSTVYANLISWQPLHSNSPQPCRPSIQLPT